MGFCGSNSQNISFEAWIPDLTAGRPGFWPLVTTLDHCCLWKTDFLDCFSSYVWQKFNLILTLNLWYAWVLWENYLAIWQISQIILKWLFICLLLNWLRLESWLKIFGVVLKQIVSILEFICVRKLYFSHFRIMDWSRKSQFVMWSQKKIKFLILFSHKFVCSGDMFVLHLYGRKDDHTFIVCEFVC